MPTADAAQENILYLVMNTATKHYDIYAKIKGSSGSYTMEQLDDTTVDLTGKVQKEVPARACPPTTTPPPRSGSWPISLTVRR